MVSIPPLSPTDRAELKSGVLPASTPAGAALGWVARDLAGLKVGPALGAGSYRGYAHIGILRGLARIGLEPDYLAGTSIGAAVAGLYAMGHSAEDSTAFLDTLDSVSSGRPCCGGACCPASPWRPRSGRSAWSPGSRSSRSRWRWSRPIWRPAARLSSAVVFCGWRCLAVVRSLASIRPWHRTVHRGRRRHRQSGPEQRGDGDGRR